MNHRGTRCNCGSAIPPTELAVERLIAQLAHVEVITPKPEQSAAFFKNVLGLEESGPRRSIRVFQAAWKSSFIIRCSSPKVLPRPSPRTGWRTEGPKEIELCVNARARNRPQRYITRGAGARRIDHVTFNTDDPFRDANWFAETLGFRFMEFAKLDHADVVVTALVSSTPMSHDLGLVLDAVDRTGKLSGIRGRANHVAFVGSTAARTALLRTADLYREAGLEIEYGPGKHGVGENLFLYVREPGGMRVELFSGGYMLYAPDIFPFEWKVSQGSLNAWNPNAMIPDGYLFDAFPPLPPAALKERVLAGDYRV